MHAKRYKLPPLNFIQGFEAAARTLSFTKAAEELSLTQSAVSRQIKALEEHLGVKLFVRRTRELALTHEGAELQRAASEVLERLQEAADRLKAADGRRPLAVTTSVGLASLWLIPRLPRFTRRHPGVDVRIAATNEIMNLERSRIDLAIRYLPPESAPSTAIRLFGEEVFPVCSPALLRQKDRPLRRPKDLEHHVLLHFDYPGAGRTFLEWDSWLASFGVGEIAPAALRFTHYEQVVQAALSGQGVALGVRALIGDHLQTGSLVVPFNRSVRSSRAYYLLEAAGAARRPHLAAFVDWLIEEAKQEDAGPRR